MDSRAPIALDRWHTPRPDHIIALVAYHLDRLGADRAARVVFSADDAPWIWNRLDWVVRGRGIDPPAW